jgi:alpha-tubulin suppressor-like RCC1 family protein
MNRTVKTFFLSILMIFLGLSAATSSLNESSEITVLEEENDSQEVILSLNLLNEPGHQEGSIFTDTTFSAAGGHTCAILDDGSLECWGEDDRGQLGGGGTDTDMNTPVSVSLGTGRTAVAVSAGTSHTCAILDDGSLRCWGADYSGQLGDGGPAFDTDKNTPVSVSLGTGRTAVAVSAGAYHTCAILDDGSLKCWGADYAGQLGDGGTNTDKDTPVSVSLGTGRTAVAVSAGDSRTCAILDDGSLNCWGYDAFGGLGDGGTNTNKDTPVSVSLGTGRTAVAIAAGGHTCAILDDGSLKCWGSNYVGQLGDGGSNTEQDTPVSVSLGTGRTAVAVSAGYGYTCAILDDGSLKCWGSDNTGQLGDGGSNTNKDTPVSVSLGTGRTAVAVSAGISHTCAILDDGSLNCWGRDFFGQLGDGGTNTDKDTPVSVSLGTTTNPRTVALSERDFDNDGTLNVFESTSSSLVSCTAGQYGFYMCVDAPLRKYVPSSGSRYATEASAGYYVPTTGQSSQTACSIGTYQALTGQSSCDDADVGQYVSSTAQSTYDLAEIGYYVPVSGSSNQTACPPFTSTSSIGSQSIDDCTLDTDLDGTPDTIDADDDNDGTIDVLDALPLDDSEDKDTDGDGVGDNLQAKLEAKFQTQMLMGGGTGILLIVIGALIFFKRKGSLPESIKEISAMDTNVMVPTNIGMGTPLTHPLPLQIGQEPLATPNAATPAHQVDANGYEWLTHSDGSRWYRIAQSNSQWTKFE